MTREDKLFARVTADAAMLQDMGFEVMAVFVQGSQNYALDYAGSDIDTKAIVLPKFEDLVTGKQPTSYTHLLPSTEHVDIKDIRMMFDVWKRQNINFLEVLYTPYAWYNEKYVNELSALIENRDAIAHANPNVLMKGIFGVMDQKYHALTHPYPACADEIEKYGYASKQLHHLLRGKEFMQRIAAGENFGSALIANDKEYLISVKANPGMYSLAEAQQLADETITWAKGFLKEYVQEHSAAETWSPQTLFDDVLTSSLHSYWESEWTREKDTFELDI